MDGPAGIARVVIARHGETAWNAAGRFQGQADVPLNEHGRLQARELAERLSREPAFAALYASDLARAFETARIVGDRLGLEPMPAPDLREIDVGSWSGLLRSEIEERWPGSLERWVAGGEVHDGETRAQLATRVERAAIDFGMRHHGARILLVAHGGVIRSLQRIVQGAPDPVLANCGTWSFSVADGRLCGDGDGDDQASRGSRGATEPIV